MKTAILHILSILLLHLNPCSFLICWKCKAYENRFDLECLQKSAQVPRDPNETTALANGLSKQECPSPNDTCVSLTLSTLHQGKILNITARNCYPWNTEISKLVRTGSSGTKCLKQDIADKTIIGDAELCACTTDLCNGNSNISHVEKQKIKENHSTKFLTKLEELEREAETLEIGVNEIKETIHELRDTA